jgi:hypothetical protein
MDEEKKIIDPALVGFYEAMEKTNTEKSSMRCWLGYLRTLAIVKTLILRVRMRMSNIGRGDLATLFLGNPPSSKDKLNRWRGNIFMMSIVRAGGEDTVPLPESDEVVVFRSFMKAGLRFPLHKMLVDVLKTFEIYLLGTCSQMLRIKNKAT